MPQLIKPLLATGGVYQTERDNTIAVIEQWSPGSLSGANTPTIWGDIIGKANTVLTKLGLSTIPDGLDQPAYNTRMNKLFDLEAALPAALFAVDADDSASRAPGFHYDFRTDVGFITNVASASLGAASRDQVAQNLALASFNDCFTFTRASTAMYLDVNGVYQDAAINTPRYDYTNGVKQLLIEEGATNSIRNSVMAGGTPGTTTGTTSPISGFPTNWATVGTGDAGISRTFVGSGVENGLPYVDVRYSGTVASALNGHGFAFDGSAAAPTVVGDNWVGSVFAKLVGGSVAAGLSINLIIQERSSGGSLLQQGPAVSISGVLDATMRRVQATRAVTDASTTWVGLSVTMSAAAGVVIDFTVRIYNPQLEKNSVVASSPIKTSGSAVTRADDNMQFSARGVELVKSRSKYSISLKGNKLINGEVSKIGPLIGFNSSNGRLFGFNVARNSILLGGTVTLLHPVNVFPPTPAIGVAVSVNNSSPKRSITYNGNAIATSSSGPVDTDTSSGQMFIGRTDASNRVCGWFDSVTIWPFAMTDAQSVAKAVAYA